MVRVDTKKTNQYIHCSTQNLKVIKTNKILIEFDSIAFINIRLLLIIILYKKKLHFVYFYFCKT